MFKRIMTSIARSRMRTALYSLSPRDLADIGINRGDIERMAKELTVA